MKHGNLLSKKPKYHRHIKVFNRKTSESKLFLDTNYKLYRTVTTDTKVTMCR